MTYLHQNLPSAIFIYFKRAFEIFDVKTLSILSYFKVLNCVALRSEMLRQIPTYYARWDLMSRQTRIPLGY